MYTYNMLTYFHICAGKFLIGYITIEQTYAYDRYMKILTPWWMNVVIYEGFVGTIFVLDFDCTQCVDKTIKRIGCFGTRQIWSVELHDWVHFVDFFHADRVMKLDWRLCFYRDGKCELTCYGVSEISAPWHPMFWSQSYHSVQEGHTE